VPDGVPIDVPPKCGCGRVMRVRWPWPATTIPKGPAFGPLYLCPVHDGPAADDAVTNPAFNRHRKGR
jgi:hypothetical protein